MDFPVVEFSVLVSPSKYASTNSPDAFLALTDTLEITLSISA